MTFTASNPAGRRFANSRTTIEHAPGEVNVTTNDETVAQSIIDAAHRVGAMIRFGGVLDANGKDDPNTIVIEASGGTGWTTAPVPGGTVGIGDLPPHRDDHRPEWHPSYGTTPPAPVADRGCGCAGDLPDARPSCAVCGTSDGGWSAGRQECPVCF